MQSTPLPDENEIELFAKQASDALTNLNFQAKRGIIMNLLEKVVGTKENLQIYGFIPVTNINDFTINNPPENTPRYGADGNLVKPVTNVNVCTNDRHRRSIPRHDFEENGLKLIPFRFEVNIPLLTVNHIQN